MARIHLAALCAADHDTPQAQAWQLDTADGTVWEAMRTQAETLGGSQHPWPSVARALQVPDALRLAITLYHEARPEHLDATLRQHLQQPTPQPFSPDAVLAPYDEALDALVADLPQRVVERAHTLYQVWFRGTVLGRQAMANALQQTAQARPSAASMRLWVTFTRTLTHLTLQGVASNAPRPNRVAKAAPDAPPPSDAPLQHPTELPTPQEAFSLDAPGTNIHDMAATSYLKRFQAKHGKLPKGFPPHITPTPEFLKAYQAWRMAFVAVPTISPAS